MRTSIGAWMAAGLVASAGACLAATEAKAGACSQTPCERRLELLTNDVLAAGPDDLYVISLTADSSGGALVAGAMTALAITYDPPTSEPLARAFVGATTITQVQGRARDRVFLFTGDPDPLDASPEAEATRASACHAFEAIRTAQLAVTLRHLGEVRLSELGEVPVPIPGALPTAATFTPSPLQLPGVPQTSPNLVFFLFVSNTPAAGGQQVFQAAIDIDGADASSLHDAVPVATLEANQSGAPPPAAIGVEGFEVDADRFAFFATQPAFSSPQVQDGELVLYDTSGAQQECLGFTPPSDAAARFDGATPNPLVRFLQPGIVSPPGTAALVAPPPGPSVLGVRSQKLGGTLVPGLFDVPLPAQAAITLPGTTSACQPGTENEVLAGAGFLSAKPELLTRLSLPVEPIAVIGVTPLDDGRFALSVELTDTAGDRLVGVEGLLDLIVTVSGFTGTATIVDGCDRELTFAPGDTSPTLALGLFVGGLADQSCLSFQLIATFDPDTPFTVTILEEDVTGATATVTFVPTPGGGIVTVSGGACGLERRAGSSGILALVPLAAVAVLAGAAAARGRRHPLRRAASPPR